MLRKRIFFFFVSLVVLSLYSCADDSCPDDDEIFREEVNYISGDWPETVGGFGCMVPENLVQMMFILENDLSMFDGCEDITGTPNTAFGAETGMFDGSSKWKAELEMSGPCHTQGKDFLEVWKPDTGICLPGNEARKMLFFTSDGFSLSACIDPIIRHDGPGGDSSDEIYHMDFTVQSKVFSNSNCDCNTDKFIFNFRNQDEFFIQANSNNLGCGNLSQWSSNPWNFSLTCIE